MSERRGIDHGIGSNDGSRMCCQDGGRESSSLNLGKHGIMTATGEASIQILYEKQHVAEREYHSTSLRLYTATTKKSKWYKASRLPNQVQLPTPQKFPFQVHSSNGFLVYHMINLTPSCDPCYYTHLVYSRSSSLSSPIECVP